MKSFLIFLRGFLMGSADVVPGVSGGTMALLTGIYPRLIAAISGAYLGVIALLKDRFKEFIQKVDLALLIPLFLGIATALITMAGLIKDALKNYPFMTLALFFGMMLASLKVIACAISKWKPMMYPLVILSAAFAWFLSDLARGLLPHSPLGIFIAGAIAISAMILPGISGAFLLLVFGKYDMVLGALKDCAKLNFEALPTIILPFVLGCLCGMGLFSSLLNYLLKHFKDWTMAVMLGLMAGAMKILWPYYEILEQVQMKDKVKILKSAPRLPTDSEPFLGPMLFLVLGLVGVLLLDKLAAPKEDHSPAVKI